MRLPGSFVTCLVSQNVYFTHDEPSSSSTSTFAFHPSSMLPGLIEESPSDSGCSDGTKATNNEDMIDATSRNLAVVDLSKPLRKEEMLAIIQILRELWRKQYGGDIPHVPMKTATPASDLSLTRRSSDEEREGGGGGERVSCSLSKQKNQYHSTPTLNKLSAELSDIKDKLKRFSTGRIMNEQRQQVQIPAETKSLGKHLSSAAFHKLDRRQQCLEKRRGHAVSSSRFAY